jgi:hypothetical protein
MVGTESRPLSLFAHPLVHYCRRSTSDDEWCERPGVASKLAREEAPGRSGVRGPHQRDDRYLRGDASMYSRLWDGR